MIISVFCFFPCSINTSIREILDSFSQGTRFKSEEGTRIPTLIEDMISSRKDSIEI